MQSERALLWKGSFSDAVAKLQIIAAIPMSLIQNELIPISFLNSFLAIRVILLSCRKKYKLYNRCMFKICNEDLDLTKIADSGQCFRMDKNEDGSWTVIAMDKLCCAKEDADGSVLFDCPDEDNAFWKCPNLADVKLPKNVVLGKNVFDKPKKKGKLTKNDREAIYQKVAKTLKVCGGEGMSVRVTTFKGTADCAKRLDQISALFPSFGILNSLQYEEKNGFFMVDISGDCDISGPGEDIDDILRFYEDELTREELEVFFALLPQKDDFWGWYYRINNEILDVDWFSIFRALVDPDFHGPVKIIYDESDAHDLN